MINQVKSIKLSDWGFLFILVDHLMLSKGSNEPHTSLFHNPYCCFFGTYNPQLPSFNSSPFAFFGVGEYNVCLLVKANFQYVSFLNRI